MHTHLNTQQTSMWQILGVMIIWYVCDICQTCWWCYSWTKKKNAASTHTQLFPPVPVLSLRLSPPTPESSDLKRRLNSSLISSCPALFPSAVYSLLLGPCWCCWVRVHWMLLAFRESALLSSLVYNCSNMNIHHNVTWKNCEVKGCWNLLMLYQGIQLVIIS